MGEIQEAGCTLSGDAWSWESVFNLPDIVYAIKV